MRGTAILILVLAASACSSDDSDSKLAATGYTCSGAENSGGECSGGVCVLLKSNQQGKAGICSELCNDGQCDRGGTCYRFPDGNQYCLLSCQTNSDCADGFICYQDSNESYCWVEL